MPPEITVPLARRPFLDLFQTFLAAWQQGTLQIPTAYLDVPASIRAHVAGWQAQTGVELPAPLFCLLATGGRASMAWCCSNSFTTFSP